MHFEAEAEVGAEPEAEEALWLATSLSTLTAPLCWQH